MDHPLNIAVAAVGHQGLPVPQGAGGLVLGDDGVQLVLHVGGEVQGLGHNAVPLQQLDGGPVGGQVGGVGVVVDELAHAVVDVVGEVVVQVVGLIGDSQVHLPVGHLEKFVQTLAGLGGDGDHRDPQLLGQALHVDLIPSGLYLVHEVQGQHQGPLQLQQLDG